MAKIKFNLMLHIKAECIMDTEIGRIRIGKSILGTASDNRLVSESLLMENGKATDAVYEITSEMLLDGLVNNIQMAHKDGAIDESDHMKRIIDYLHERFVSVERPDPKDLKEQKV